MQDIDLEISRLREDIAREAQLRARLSDMHPRRERLAAEERRLAALRAGEDEDVERLECGSLARYFYSLTGSLEERLERERREAREAAVRHDAAKRELADLEEDILECSAELDALRGCRERYNAAVESKARQLKASGSPAGGRIAELERELERNFIFCRETEEAARAGERAEAAAHDALDSLSAASDFGTLDLFTDSLLVNFAKHERLDSAQSHIEQLRTALRRFDTELADIGAKLNVEIGSFLGFADFVFDNIFVDLAVNSRIEDAGRAVGDAAGRIGETLARLRVSLAAALERRGELEEEYERLVTESR